MKKMILATAALTLAMLSILPAKAVLYNDWDFTPESDIPPFKQGDVVYHERDFETFLDLLQAAESALHAYQLTERKFGKFPLRFRGGQFLIVSIRPYHIHVRAGGGCVLPAIRAEYLDLNVQPVANPYANLNESASVG